MPETPATQTGRSVQRSDGASMQQLYADARATARTYPAPRLPQQRLPEQRTADRLTAESHWRDICAQLISARSLSPPFRD